MWYFSEGDYSVNEYKSSETTEFGNGCIWNKQYPDHIVMREELFTTQAEAEKYAIKFLKKEKKRLSNELKNVQSALTKLLPAQDVTLAEWFDYMNKRNKREATE